MAVDSGIVGRQRLIEDMPGWQWRPKGYGVYGDCRTHRLESMDNGVILPLSRVCSVMVVLSTT